MTAYLLSCVFDLKNLFQRIFIFITTLHLQGSMASGRFSFMLCQEVEKMEDVNFTLVKRGRKILGCFQKDGVPA